jgi:hypothetical protein
MRNYRNRVMRAHAGHRHDSIAAIDRNDATIAWLVRLAPGRFI